MALSFGDNVRVRVTPETEAAGVAGLAGSVFGVTTPSITGVQVIGRVESDVAINVFLEEKGEGLWFAEDLLEFVDMGVGWAIRLKGVPKQWVRQPSGEWAELPYVPSPPRSPSWWQRLVARVKRNA